MFINLLAFLHLLLHYVQQKVFKALRKTKLIPISSYYITIKEIQGPSRRPAENSEVMTHSIVISTKTGGHYVLIK
ncbi:hypothetical protein HS7_12740 [Sulfolobales archaeon HS-7]|nr:hypothetical protein HS7_12740 [Sulfolobales archaeon HS-7]